jgi:hypothetical protein
MYEDKFDPENLPSINDLLGREELSTQDFLDTFIGHASVGNLLNGHEVIELAQKLKLHPIHLSKLAAAAMIGISKVYESDMVMPQEHIGGYASVIGYAQSELRAISSNQ